MISPKKGIQPLNGFIKPTLTPSEQLKRAGELFGVSIDSSTAQENFGEYQNQPKSEQYAHNNMYRYTAGEL
jgi:hypothetical protein